MWDPRQAASAQDAQDAELRRVMSCLAAALGCDIPSTPAKGPSTATNGVQPSASDGSFEAISSGARLQSVAFKTFMVDVRCSS